MMKTIKCKCGHKVDNHDRWGCQHAADGRNVCDCFKTPNDIASALTAELEAVKRERDELREALAALAARLDVHFGGVDKSYDWKEQAAARAALKAGER